MNYLTGVVAISTNDVWSVGYYLNNKTLQTLTEHWDGTSWSIVPSLNPDLHSDQLHRVARVTNTGQVWSVGDRHPYNQRTLTERRDGTALSVIPSWDIVASAAFLIGAIFPAWEITGQNISTWAPDLDSEFYSCQ